MGELTLEKQWRLIVFQCLSCRAVARALFRAKVPSSKAHRLLYHSTLGLRVIKNKQKLAVARAPFGAKGPPSSLLSRLELSDTQVYEP